MFTDLYLQPSLGRASQTLANMLSLFTVGLLALASANHLDTVGIPAYRKTLQRNAPGTLSHRLEHNGTWLTSGWFTEIGVGEPPQYLELLIDTGSSDIWIPAAQAKQCRERQCGKGSCKTFPTRHSPSRSPTFVILAGHHDSSPLSNMA